VVHTALKEAAACMTTDVIRIVFFKPWPPPAYIHTTGLSVVVQPVRTPDQQIQITASGSSKFKRCLQPGASVVRGLLGLCISTRCIPRRLASACPEIYWLPALPQPVRIPRSTNENYCIRQFEIQMLPAAWGIRCPGRPWLMHLNPPHPRRLASACPKIIGFQLSLPAFGSLMWFLPPSRTEAPFIFRTHSC
jgi:hypothetical protein